MTDLTAADLDPTRREFSTETLDQWAAHTREFAPVYDQELKIDAGDLLSLIAQARQVATGCASRSRSSIRDETLEAAAGIEDEAVASPERQLQTHDKTCLDFDHCEYGEALVEALNDAKARAEAIRALKEQP